MDSEILIVGAGAAGLAAADELRMAGDRALVVEARDRIGGRVLTHHSPAAPIAIELGAEFVHGRPPEILDFAGRHNLPIIELQGRRWCSDRARLGACDDFTSDTAAVFDQMNADGPDHSFAEFLDSIDAPDDAKRWAVAYVEGFNAARRNRISVHSLVQADRASAQIEGDRLFRIRSGYDALIAALAGDTEVRTSTIVERVRWQPGRVELDTSAGRMLAARAIVTVPLPVLTDLAFEPALPAKRAASAQLEMGEVIRVTIRFREAFWEDRARDLLLLHSHDEVMPTWWTTHPLRSTLLTGWAAGRRGRNLSALPADAVCGRAVAAIGRLLREPLREIETLVEEYHVHDWQSDPFARGAYSYVRPGGMAAPAELAKCVANTLYFAGEATEREGHSGTVHGAIRSGRRAARELLDQR